MRLLNLGCGNTRPLNQEWTNVDSWEGGGHEINEPNFVFHDLRNPLPFEDESYDGVLLSHVLEHMNCQAGLKLFLEVKRVLKKGGIFMVSVPDASYFRDVYREDKNENWPHLFDVSDPPNPIPTFFEAALWFDQHEAILTEDALWAYFTRAGYDIPVRTYRFTPHDDAVLVGRPRLSNQEVFNQLTAQLNRLKFSLIMSALKP